jgi:hypothetical protein
MWKACNRLGQTTQRAWERSQNNIRKHQVRDRQRRQDSMRPGSTGAQGTGCRVWRGEAAHVRGTPPASRVVIYK